MLSPLPPVKVAINSALTRPPICRESAAPGRLIHDRSGMNLIRGLKVTTILTQGEIEAFLPSLTKQRREILPNPGCLDKIIDDEKEKKNLELLPGSKKRSKNLIKIDITDHYNEAPGPLIDLQKQTPLLPRSSLSNALAH